MYDAAYTPLEIIPPNGRSDDANDANSYNTANNSAAVTSQYGGNDDINAAMWLLK